VPCIPARGRNSGREPDQNPGKEAKDHGAAKHSRVDSSLIQTSQISGLYGENQAYTRERY
jgi:hypothetical protein